MKKLLFAIPFVALFSCNTEIPREQFVEKLTSDCISKQSKQFLGENATQAEKDSFCKCYAETIAGDGSEAITMKTMIDKMKDTASFTSQLEGCKKDALGTTEAKPEVAPEAVTETEVKTEVVKEEVAH